MASYENLKKQFQDIATAAGSTTGEIDDDVLDKIIAGTHGSYSVADDTIVRRPGEGYVAPETTPRDTSTRSRNDMRRELLLPDYRKQAAQQVNPQFDRLTNQLQSQIAATRGRIPRQLLARGQAVGGQRTLQEGELDRQLAYGTADLEAQRQMAINQAAQGLRQQGLEQQRWETEQQFRERQLASDENRFQQQFAYDQEQDAFNNYMQQRSLELQEQGMAFDQAQAQAEFEYQQNRDAINDDFRRWQTSMMYGGRGTSGTGGTATPQEDSFDINPYMDRIENGGYLNDPQALIQYINTRDIPESAKQQLRNLYGVTQRTSDLGVAGQTRPEYKYEAITPKVEPEPVDYPMSYVEAKKDVLSTATDMNGNVNAEIVAQQVDALVAAGQISPDVARAIYSPYAQQE
jgi:hypothetical protein